MGQWEELWKEVRGGRKEFELTRTAQGQFALTEEEESIDEAELEQEISRSKLMDLVDNMLADAARVDASDIHVVPRGSRSTEFRFRIDGKLSLWHTLDDVRAEAVSAVVKDRGRNLDRFERNMAQDGFSQMIVDGKTIRYRFSVIPIVGRELRNKYESIAIRVLQEPKLATSLADLGFGGHAEQEFLRAIKKPYGLVIVTGPTGSGKSTTLVAALRAVMNPQVNVITVEDPVEYLIEGARQAKLNPKLDFEGALRAILRHDPDIVMVGEMRDRITAEIAIKLANTGHLTFSTLHTNDAPSAISRLYKMGVEPFLIAYAINIVLSQRLLRKLCPRCRKPLKEVDIEAFRKLGLSDKEVEQTTFYRPVGCSRCIRGYKGRIAVHEALYFSKEIRRMILQSGTSIDEDSIRRQGLEEGMQTLRMSATNLLKQGITTLEEVVSTTTED
jgi:type IV pilus assembly protein PilB